MKRKSLFCIISVSVLVFATLCGIAACAPWTPDPVYDTEYVFTGSFRNISPDDEGGWQGFIIVDHAGTEEASPRAAFERLKGEIDWSGIYTDTDGSNVRLEGISAASSTDDILKSLDAYVANLNKQLGENSPYKDIKVSVSSKDSPSITISVPNKESQTFTAEVIANDTQVLFGDRQTGVGSSFTLRYSGTTTKTFGLALQLEPAEAQAVFGEDIPMTIGVVRLNFPKVGSPDTTLYCLDLFLDFTVQKA